MSATSLAAVEAGCKACEWIVRPFRFYCVAITWQQIFEGLLQVTLVGALLRVVCSGLTRDLSQGEKIG